LGIAVKPWFVFEVWVVDVIVGDGLVLVSSPDWGIVMAVPYQEFRIGCDRGGCEEEGSVVDELKYAVGELVRVGFVGQHRNGVSCTTDVGAVFCWVGATINGCGRIGDPKVRGKGGTPEVGKGCGGYFRAEDWDGKCRW
jgi:hypothetical protein